MASVKMSVLGLALVLALSCVSGCFTVAGGILGGGTGAIIGGGVGLCKGQPVEGMKTGAAVGAGAGALLGLTCDSVILSPFAIVGSVLGHDKANEALTAKEIEKLHTAGVDDQVIIAQIEKVGMKKPLSVKEIMQLNKQGVDPKVIQVAQQHPKPVPATSPDTSTTPTTLPTSDGRQLTTGEAPLYSTPNTTVPPACRLTPLPHASILAPLPPVAAEAPLPPPPPSSLPIKASYDAPVSASEIAPFFE